jgi:signal peptidase I
MSNDPLDKILESIGIEPDTPNSPDERVSDEQEVAKVLNNAEKLEPPKYPDKLRRRILIACLVILSLITLQLTRAFIFQTHQVVGNSMQPTLHENDRLIISKFGRKWSSIRGKSYIPPRGSIIAFTDPQDSKLQLVKRVIGLPGDRIVVKDGQVLIYNSQKPDGFSPGKGTWADRLDATSGEVDLTLKDGQLFVLGDNRPGAYSLDSRTFGPISTDSVIGRVTLRIWPFSNRTKF